MMYVHLRGHLRGTCAAAALTCAAQNRGPSNPRSSLYSYYSCLLPTTYYSHYYLLLPTTPPPTHYPLLPPPYALLPPIHSLEIAGYPLRLPDTHLRFSECPPEIAGHKAGIFSLSLPLSLSSSQSVEVERTVLPDGQQENARFNRGI